MSLFLLPSSLRPSPVLVLLIMMILLSNCLTTSAASCLPRERNALLDFKHYAISQDAVADFWLSSWVAESQLLYLNLAYNKLTDGIFQSKLYGVSIFQYLKNLTVLDLGYNQLQGLSFPPSTSVLNPELLILNMGNNRLQGPVPGFIRCLRKLKVLDLGRNELSGGIPLWIGFSQSQHLRVLNLAGNQLTGAIPASLGLLSAMQKYDSIDEYSVQIDYDYEYMRIPIEIAMSIKGQNRVLKLKFLMALDLSENQLSGPIPSDLGKLRGLLSVNLSGNHLDGGIPAALGNMTNLESLDLSRNMLQGHIPDSLSGLDSLGFVNLSSNHLTGRIPSSRHWDTFSYSSFLDNDGLCTANANPVDGLPTCGSLAIASPTIIGRLASRAREGAVELVGFVVGYPLGFLLGFLINVKK